jgi:hypothetical protein
VQGTTCHTSEQVAGQAVDKCFEMNSVDEEKATPHPEKRNYKCSGACSTDEYPYGYI